MDPEFERMLWTWIGTPLVVMAFWGIAYPFRKLCQRLPDGKLKRFLLWAPRERRHYR